ncbi:hypothetical protein ACFZAT_26475 [Streptomyces sp. NPDC008163]|uniref:hypothetical protein n=1 Tax=Streptomyces sp. NPDC008163 TaxID=3364818 RepID=UPI0036E7952D
MADDDRRMPAPGWQQALASALAEYVAGDGRVHAIHVHGSAAGSAGAVDPWSDLDVRFTADEPVSVAEDVVREISERHAPVYASARDGDAGRHTVRLVLVDLRRVDLTFHAASQDGSPAAASPPAAPDLHGVLASLVNDFRFDAVLAATKAARLDVLIGAHLTLGLARHVLVAAMVLRDRERGTTHHRYGGTRYDNWAARLAVAPAPYDPGSVVAAIRFHTLALSGLLAEHGVPLAVDDAPLRVLLDAVDAALAADDRRTG